ncbi:MAG: DUF2752 domain-containing protein [Chitinophagaceae bacterium]|nr:MAG: DUF2752 domain-containing protein [Chitinophagaceae bacterium]
MKFSAAIRRIQFLYFELSVWIGGLVLLAYMNPAADSHYSLCVFKWAGIAYCPGCGLGHSINWLLHGDIVRSLSDHPLGIFAFLIITHRIFKLLKRNYHILTA